MQVLTFCTFSKYKYVLNTKFISNTISTVKLVGYLVEDAHHQPKIDSTWYTLLK